MVIPIIVVEASLNSVGLADGEELRNCPTKLSEGSDEGAGGTGRRR